jgi:hypothetical protein
VSEATTKQLLKQARRTSLGTGLVQDTETTLSTANGITSLDDVASPAITASIFHASYNGQGSGWGCARDGRSVAGHGGREGFAAGRKVQCARWHAVGSTACYVVVETTTTSLPWYCTADRRGQTHRLELCRAFCTELYVGAGAFIFLFRTTANKDNTDETPVKQSSSQASR